MIKKLPAPKLLHKLLRYDPQSGKLYWRPRTRAMFSTDASFKGWNIRFADKEAFTAASKFGHKTGGINGQVYLAHRVIWCMHYMCDPVHQIDHINGHAADNRISNLRDVPHIENSKNQKANAKSVTGVTGVGWHKREQKWRADIKADGKQMHLGYFDDFPSAVTARLEAEERLGYHQNHGRR